MQIDLNLAKQRLIREDLSLVIAKKGRVIFETKATGVAGLLEAVETLGNFLTGSSVADKVVGRAAALLIVYSRALSVFAVTISDSGIEVLMEHAIRCEFDNRVPNILSISKTDVCPFEKLVAELSDPKLAFEVLKARCGR